MRFVAAVAGALALSGCLTAVNWMPDGKHLAYVQGGAVWIADLEGNAGKIHESPRAVLERSALAVSPDGERIAFLEKLGKDRYELSLLAVAGGVQVKLPLAGRFLVLQRHWSPDGSRLLLPEEVDGARVVRVLEAKDGRVGPPIATGSPYVRFSDSGEMLAFSLDAAAGLGKVARYSPQGDKLGEDPWTLPRGYEALRPVRLSADGALALVAGKRGEDSVALVVDAAGTVRHERRGRVRGIGLTGLSYLVDDDGYAMVFPLKDREVGLTKAFAAMAGLERSGHERRAEAGAKPFDARQMGFFPVFSPDGSLAALYGKSALYLMDARTGGLRELVRFD